MGGLAFQSNLITIITLLGFVHLFKTRNEIKCSALWGMPHTSVHTLHYVMYIFVVFPTESSTERDHVHTSVYTGHGSSHGGSLSTGSPRLLTTL